MNSKNHLELMLATSFWQRLRGLLWRAPLHVNQGLCLTPCKAIHTFGMTYALDIIFLDNSFNLCRQINSLPPNRWAYCRRAFMAIELPAGFCKRNSDFLQIVQQRIRIALQDSVCL